MEWALAISVVILVAMWIMSHAAGDDGKPGQPKDCTCLWFTDSENQPYRALTDVNCRHHEGN